MLSKMNPDLKHKWIEALRSGKYEQGEEGTLKDLKGGYCCIGVLGEISGINLYSSDAVESYGLIPHDGLKRVLWRMNDGADGHRYSFCEIADYIEQNDQL